MAPEMYPPALVELYDTLYPDVLGELPRMAGFVARLAPGKRVLEYGVGTGRIAFPLVDAGLEVTGIDNSELMLQRLAARDDGGKIKHILGNFVTDRFDREYDAVLLMVNTLFVAMDLDQQVAVFCNAVNNLASDGVFVVETFNPQPYHTLTAPMLTMRPLTPEITLFEQFIAEPSQQILITNNRVAGPEQNFMYTHVIRYMLPNEMDAVARIAGLALVSRTSDFEGTPFTASSPRAVSVYGRMS